MGILVMTLAIVNLNYFKPHKVTLIVWMTQLSFVVVVWKYVLAMLLTVMESEGSSKDGLLRIGFLMICLDVAVMMSSL